MPTKLADFLSDPSRTGAPLRIPATGKKLPKSNYIGLALIPKNTLPDIGSATTFTPPPSGTAAPVTVLNLISVLQALAFNGQAYVFGNGVINGKRGKPKEDKEKVVFGSRRKPRPLGETEETYEFTFKYAYMNRMFLNQLRLNFSEYDAYVFTDSSVETVRFDLAEPIFEEVGDETAGDNDAEVTGGFQMSIGTDGQIDPDFGNFEQLLAISNFKFSFGAPTVTGTGLTSTLGGTVINKTSSGSGTIANAVTQTVGANVVSYSLANTTGGAVPTGLTIDTATGTITVAAGVTAGTYNLVVAVENKTGVMGEYRFRLVAA